MPKYMLKNGQKKQPLQGYRNSIRNGVPVRELFDIVISPGEVVDTDDVLLEDWVEMGIIDAVYEAAEVVGLDPAYCYDDPSKLIDLGDSDQDYYDNSVDSENKEEDGFSVGFVQVEGSEINDTGEITVASTNEEEYMVVDLTKSSDEKSEEKTEEKKEVPKKRGRKKRNS